MGDKKKKKKKKGKRRKTTKTMRTFHIGIFFSFTGTKQQFHVFPSVFSLIKYFGGYGKKTLGHYQFSFL